MTMKCIVKDMIKKTINKELQAVYKIQKVKDLILKKTKSTNLNHVAQMKEWRNLKDLKPAKKEVRRLHWLKLKKGLLRTTKLKEAKIKLNKTIKKKRNKLIIESGWILELA